jgi:hypothetical protein
MVVVGFRFNVSRPQGVGSVPHGAPSDGAVLQREHGAVVHVMLVPGSVVGGRRTAPARCPGLTEALVAGRVHLPVTAIEEGRDLSSTSGIFAGSS